MNFCIQCGFSKESSKFMVVLRSADPSVAAILSEVKVLAAKKYPWFDLEGYYLAHPIGPFRLDNLKSASDYQLSDGDTILLLMDQGMERRKQIV